MPHALSWAPGGSRLAYDAYDPDAGGPVVFTVDVNGGAPRKVAAGWAPSWGPGDKLAIVARSVTGDARIHVVNAEGTGKRELQPPCPEAYFNGCSDGDPDWSPDGSRLAFDTKYGQGSALWTMEAAGSGRVIITPFFPAAERPRWSPNGARIAYQFGGDVAVMNADGSGSRIVVKDAKSPDWSPDGKTIVFSRPGTTGQTLVVVGADGSHERPLTGEGDIPGGSMMCVVPNVTGKTLATAKTALAKAHCTAGKVTNVRSNSVPAGRVVSTRPSVGASKPAGTAVALIVSRGRK